MEGDIYIRLYINDSTLAGVPPVTITTLSSRAKKAASTGPVFITDRGRPAHVLPSIEEYQRITNGHRKIADELAMPGLADIEFDPPRVSIDIQPADLS